MSHSLSNEKEHFADVTVEYATGKDIHHSSSGSTADLEGQEINEKKLIRKV